VKHCYGFSIEKEKNAAVNVAGDVTLLKRREYKSVSFKYCYSRMIAITEDYSG
jgi:hypothetical protein